MTEERLQKLEQVVKGKRVLILLHNNPDPDAIAAGWALSYLLKKKFQIYSILAYGGLITRAENRTMVRLLNIPIHALETVSVNQFSVVALLDTQPQTGNTSLPPRVKPSIVIDHHGLRKSTQKVDFIDIRPHYGSSATILTEYLIQAVLPIPKRIATALFYGLKTDTQNLGRHAIEADYQAAITLYQKSQLKILSQIENPELSRDYFIDFDRALHEARIYGKAVWCDLGVLVNTDMVSLMADFLLRFSGAQWSLVIATHDSRLIFSLRTKRSHQNSGQLARRLVKGLGTAGGHGRTGGGQISLQGLPQEKSEKMQQVMQKRFLKMVGQDNTAEESLLS